MSSDDENTTTQLEPKYQLRSNTQSLELISLSSRSSRRYHQASTAPLSSSITPTRNSGSGYITSMVHQSPFGGAHQWGTPIAALLSHHHRIFRCKSLPLHPYTPWKLAVLVGELRSSAEGQVLFL